MRRVELFGEGGGSRIVEVAGVPDTEQPPATITFSGRTYEYRGESGDHIPMYALRSGLRTEDRPAARRGMSLEQSRRVRERYLDSRVNEIRTPTRRNRSVSQGDYIIQRLRQDARMYSDIRMSSVQVCITSTIQEWHTTMMMWRLRGPENYVSRFQLSAERFMLRIGAVTATEHQREDFIDEIDRLAFESGAEFANILSRVRTGLLSRAEESREKHQAITRWKRILGWKLNIFSNQFANWYVYTGHTEEVSEKDSEYLEPLIPAHAEESSPVTANGGDIAINWDGNVWFSEQGELESVSQALGQREPQVVRSESESVDADRRELSIEIPRRVRALSHQIHTSSTVFSALSDTAVSASDVVDSFRDQVSKVARFQRNADGTVGGILIPLQKPVRGAIREDGLFVPDPPEAD